MATNTTINGYDYYRLRKKIGEKDGEPVLKPFYGENKSDAEDKYDKWREAQIRAEYERKIADLSTLSERADQFIENALKPSHKYAEGTKERYESSYRTHVRGTWLDKMVVSDIEASDIQKFYNELDVSESSLKAVNKFMSAFYKWLVLNRYATNILDAVELPAKPSTKRHEDIVIWTDDEIQQITENLGDYRLRFLVYVLLYTGIRIGEALSLKYSDFDGDTLRIRRQWNLGEIKPPKAGSVRDIPLHVILKEELKRHRTWHEKEMQEQGYDTDYVFTTSAGGLLDSKNCRRSLERYYERIGIQKKHTHTYRSTFCTQLCRLEVPIEVASKLLGHSNISVTAKHYAFIRHDTKMDAISKFFY